MKFIHLADLHLGKVAYGHSMIEDQKYILDEVLTICDRQKPDAAVVAGDVYDRSIPSEEAINLLGDFLTGLRQRDIPVLIISGNHDSAARLGFGSRFMSDSGVFISPPFAGAPAPITLQDEFGPVNFYLLPFVKPYQVREAYPDEAVDSYESAVSLAIQHMNVNTSERNVLVAHQFVDTSKIGEVEDAQVGGTDKISRDVFADFDYTALGHIHKQWNVSETIRYCGTPLKYSFDDDDTKQNKSKSVTIVTLGQKADGKTDLTVDSTSEPLTPLRDMRMVRGTYDEIVQAPPTEDYLDITLTDSQEILNAMDKLRTYFPNALALQYDNEMTNNELELGTAQDVETRDPLELFEDFFHERTGKYLTEDQEEIMAELVEKVWGERE